MPWVPFLAGKHEQQDRKESYYITFHINYLFLMMEAALRILHLQAADSYFLMR